MFESLKVYYIAEPKSILNCSMPSAEQNKTVDANNKGRRPKKARSSRCKGAGRKRYTNVVGASTACRRGRALELLPKYDAELLQLAVKLGKQYRENGLNDIILKETVIKKGLQHLTLLRQSLALKLLQSTEYDVELLEMAVKLSKKYPQTIPNDGGSDIEKDLPSETP